MSKTTPTTAVTASGSASVAWCLGVLFSMWMPWNSPFSASLPCFWIVWLLPQGLVAHPASPPSSFRKEGDRENESEGTSPGFPHSTLQTTVLFWDLLCWRESPNWARCPWLLKTTEASSCNTAGVVSSFLPFSKESSFKPLFHTWSTLVPEK